MHRRLFLLSLAGIALLPSVPHRAAAADNAADDDAAAIRRLLAETFDRPEQRLSVDPVVVEADAAIAGWTQGAMGGRAFLRRIDGEWVLTVCAGDALKSVETLRNLGLAEEQARRLLASLQAAERGVPTARLKAFASFGGLQNMGGTHRH